MPETYVGTSGAAGRAGIWATIVTIAGVDVTESIFGNIVINADEDSARVADLTIAPASTGFTVAAWVGKAVTIDIAAMHTGSPTSVSRLFTGIIDTPVLDLVGRRIGLREGVFEDSSEGGQGVSQQDRFGGESPGGQIVDSLGDLVEQHGGQPQAGQIPDFVLAVFGRPGQLDLGRFQVASIEGLAGGNDGAQGRVAGAAEFLGQFAGSRLRRWRAAQPNRP